MNKISNDELLYKEKYIKYKSKYLNLQEQEGGLFGGEKCILFFNKSAYSDLHTTEEIEIFKNFLVAQLTKSSGSVIDCANASKKEQKELERKNPYAYYLYCKIDKMRRVTDKKISTIKYSDRTENLFKTVQEQNEIPIKKLLYRKNTELVEEKKKILLRGEDINCIPCMWKYTYGDKEIKPIFLSFSYRTGSGADMAVSAFDDLQAEYIKACTLDIRTILLDDGTSTKVSLYDLINSRKNKDQKYFNIICNMMMDILNNCFSYTEPPKGEAVAGVESIDATTNTNNVEASKMNTQTIESCVKRTTERKSSFNKILENINTLYKSTKMPYDPTEDPSVEYHYREKYKHDFPAGFHYEYNKERTIIPIAKGFSVSHISGASSDYANKMETADNFAKLDTYIYTDDFIYSKAKKLKDTSQLWRNAYRKFLSFHFNKGDLNFKDNSTYKKITTGFTIVS